MKKNVQWSNYVKTITLIVSLVLIAAEVLLLVFLYPAFDWIMLLCCILIVAVSLYCAMMAPMTVSFDDSAFVLHKLIGKIQISCDTILEIGEYEPGTGELRIFGSGGFLGFTGLFWNKQFGKYWSYVGCYKQAFYIITENKKYVFSCENRDAIISAINKVIKPGRVLE